MLHLFDLDIAVLDRVADFITSSQSLCRLEAALGRHELSSRPIHRLRWARVLGVEVGLWIYSCEADLPPLGALKRALYMALPSQPLEGGWHAISIEDFRGAVALFELSRP